MPGTPRLAAPAAFIALAALAFAQDAPPSLTYGSSRSSESWVDTAKGRVAVDRGVAWKGVKVWLSLTWDLVATDEATGKTLWAESVGAFWNEIGFREVETRPGVTAWAVELRPGPRARAGADRRQYHDLRSGARIEQPEPPPSGKKLDLKGGRSGDASAIAEPLRRVVATAAAWADLRASMFHGLKPAPDFDPVEFGTHVVLVISSGDAWNSRGFEAQAWEDDRRILVRLRELTFQTSGPDGGGRRVRPWGTFVLPRRDPFKPIVVERNAQNLIGGPAIWKELCRFEAAGDAVGGTATRQKR
jgi:hypothetical protein